MRKNAQLPKLSDKAAIAASLLMFLAMFGFLRVSPTYAQSRASGEIRGTVLDSSGAAVPGVAVSILNQLTGVVTRLTSDNAGVYDAASLDPGTYTVSFEKEGFKKVIKSDITLYVEAITVNATSASGLGKPADRGQGRGGPPGADGDLGPVTNHYRHGGFRTPQRQSLLDGLHLPVAGRQWADDIQFFQ